MTNTEMVSKLLKGQQVHSHSQVMEAVMHRSKKIADLPVMSLDPKEFQAYIGLSSKQPKTTDGGSKRIGASIAPCG